MSFGGGGGFGGFGSNNNQSTGFGFGANNNNTSGGFGSNTGNAFGSNNTGGNMFGGNTTSTFGGGGGFGANNNTTTSAFGSKPFGASTTGGGLFGGGGTTGGTTFGGFGASNTNNASSGFGGASATTGTSLFGGAKPAFGAGSTTNTGGGLFGGGGSTGGFGSNNTGGGFGGGATGGGFGAGAANTTNNGTASTPFQAHTEKDGTSATQHYQTITFQQPYTNFSLEELRLADYNQGRRYGNANGQGGAFGQTSGFGGFGANNNNTNTTPAFGANNTNTGGGIFGGASTTNTTGGFGQAAGGFGANNNTNTGGGLFGAKPATGGGLFGGSNTASTGTTGGGLFGGASNTNTTGGFGSGGGFGAANNTSNTGGGLFGSNNAAKPATGFGATNTTTGFGASTNTGFGQSNTTGGGLFGQNNQASAAPAFGGAAATANSGGGLFGGNTGSAFGQNNNTQAPASGGLFGGGGFGQNNNQAKPATGGLFGGGAATTNTGGGLFGSANTTTPAPATGGLFGSSTANNNTGGGLFGGAAKPAATGGLFGGASTTNTGAAGGGGLFGNLGGQNNQPNAGNSLFGGQNNQQKPGGLFGSSTTNTNTGGGLFGGSLGQNNQQQGNLGGSLFGASQNNQQQNQQQNGNSLFGASGSSLLNTSLQTNPYGNDALFAGLATPTQSPGPIATPLSSSQKNKKSAILPQHKLNPASSTRLLTPQAKRTGGYGFSYSTYGSPASSQATPNLGGSLFAGGSLSRSLGSRSTSMSNLRNSYTPEASILAPGAFSATGRSFGNGSLKKLNVNRSLNTRIPLFDEPAAKRVSFAGGDGNTLNGSVNGETAMVVRRDDGDASPRSVNGDASPEPSRPAMQQVNGNELARVPENDSALTPKSSSAINAQPGEDPEPGEYWSQPSLQQLKKMSKQELKSVRNFTVGRHNIGQIEFHQGAPVDLSETNIDLLFSDIVQLNHRNATVYGENCTCLPKPPMGTALNHPSRVTLYNSWPRNKAGRKDAKHLERLKRVAGTTFESYDAATGGWVFTVPHFSSYGLDYENDYSDDENDESSELSPVPDTPAQTLLNTSQMTSTPQQDSLISPDGSSPDDTFDFKRGLRQRASVPGCFGDEAAYEEYEDDEEDSRDESFLGERSVGSFDGQPEADYFESESELDQDQSMADSVSGPIHTTEPAAATESDPFRSTLKAPKSILKASQIFKPGFGTPSKGPAVFDDDWADQLQRTISPRKQDRTALRESQGYGLRDQNGSPTFAVQSVNARPFATHMDLMNSLFGETEDHRESFSKRQGQGIELPYPKRPKSSHDLDEMTADDKDFHNSSKPHFSENGVLIYGNKGTKNLEDGAFSTAHQPLADASKDIRFLKMPTFDDSVSETLSVQKQQTKISTSQGVPFATIITDPAPIEFSSLAKAVAVDTVAGSHEQHAWQLLSLLFDGADRIKKPADVDSEHIQRYRKERLSEFWKNLVYHDAQKHAQEAATAEERAIAQLSCNNVAEACHALLEGLDLRLATMIAQIGGDPNMRQTMSTQIEEWRRLDMLAEMEDAHRALYELLSGNCAQADGKLGNGRENKAATFNISSRFALDWRRAFGLRLWYGTLVDEPIELAVAQFADAVRDGLEVVKPVPWFIRDSADMGWTDPDAANREDLLWGILKLYASSKLDIPANVEDVLAPENVSGHPLNARLSFQLFQLFYSRHKDEVEEPERKVGMPTVRDDSEGDFRRSFMSSTATVTNKDTQGADPLVELGDKITLSYAASLHTQAHWTTAIWVYTHLSSAAMREHYIRSLINQFAKSLNLTESDRTYVYLTDELHIPATWLHAAAALQAKTEGDAVREATHLIKAEELEEAHEVLCRKVGPDAIISRDYEPLRELMAGFLPEDSDGPANDSASLASSRRSAFSRATERVAGWAQGGQIYLDYIELLDHTGRRSTYRVDEELEQEIQHLLSKLQQALEIAARDRLESCGLEERVALMEIAGTVANLVAKNKQIANRSQILKLPLTEDLWLKHSCDLSTNYYRTMMANKR